VGSQEKKVLKVGSTNNIENRVNTLNFENYASINDWKLILYYKCNDMGLIEAEAHNKLQKFQVEKTYIKNGRAQTAYEIFDCNYDVCKIALVNATKDNIIEKYEDELLSKKYYFNNTKKISKVETNIKLINKVANKVNLIKINTINAQKKESPIPKITKETMYSLGSIYWHCLAGHTVYPVQVAEQMKIPLIIWGEHQGLQQVGMFSHEHEVEMTRRYRKDLVIEN
jgi:hypothetical protein